MVKVNIKCFKTTINYLALKKTGSSKSLKWRIRFRGYKTDKLILSSIEVIPELLLHLYLDQIQIVVSSLPATHD